MTIELRKSCLFASFALSLAVANGAQAANPTAQEALTLLPVQKDVQIDRPDAAELAKCTIKAEKAGGKSGWVVRDGSGEILRIFMDTNGDNQVDQWCYYKDGIEVYRDIDSNFNKKADQHRWLNTAGTRWGVDTNEDGKIDAWKVISAEEATGELVAALAEKDRARFERILLNPKDIKGLGLGAAKTEQLAKKVEAAIAEFPKLASRQKAVNRESKWVSFGGTQPGMVPQGTDDSTADLMVYENVMAMVETDGKALPITVGTLVHVKDTWRLIDVPQMSDDATAEIDSKPFFYAIQRTDRPEQQANKPNDKSQQLMEELRKLGDLAPDSTPEQHAKRAELLEQLAQEGDAEMRVNWYHQLADTLSAAVQTGTYPGGLDRLKALHEKLKADPKDDELAAYVQFRWMTAEHGQELSKPNVDFAKIQEKWVGELEKFVESAKQYPDSADAMLELAIAQEFGGDDEKALKWYEEIVKGVAPTSPIHRRALGAKTRLSSIGKPIPLRGKTLDGKPFDLARLKDKAVVVQYWATWCEPCKSDMPLLKELRGKFKDKFEVVGVCLDNNKKDMMAFLAENDPRWPQLFEEGGLDGRFATELGIQTLPTMILIDPQGRVVNRNIRAQELESELKKLMLSK